MNIIAVSYTHLDVYKRQPFVLIGLLPFIHGLCTGNDVCFFIGVFCIVGSGADCYYFWILRSFNGNDKIVDGDESLSATIIKNSY